MAQNGVQGLGFSFSWEFLKIGPLRGRRDTLAATRDYYLGLYRVSADKLPKEAKKCPMQTPVDYKADAQASTGLLLRNLN